MTTSTILQNVSADQLEELLTNVLQTQLKDLKKQLISQTENEDLLSREEVLDLLKINASTLWHWQKKGRIKVYKFANKCYYKRSELMDGLITKK